MLPTSVDDDFVERADAFPAELSARAHEESENRFQGMPTAAQAKREGWTIVF